MTKPTFIIIDGNSFMHRAYHGMPTFFNKKGFPTNILAGVCSMINGQLTKIKPERIVVAFDHKGKTFRHDMYDNYKGDRTSMGDDFKMQIQPLKDIIEAWGLPMMSIAGVEADDSMSTMALRAKEEGYSVIMLTSDKDMCQIVQEDIGILDTKDMDKSSTVLYRDGVKEKIGVYPEQIISLLSLMGDKADSIPGVPSVGQKTAVKWLDAYGDLQGVIEHKYEIKGKVGEKLIGAIDDGTLALSEKLVIIERNVDLGKPLDEFVGVKDEQRLIELLNEYELFKFKKSLGVVDENAETANASIISDPAQITAFTNTVLFKEQQLFVEVFEDKGTDFLLLGTESSEDIFVFDIEKNIPLLSKTIRLIANNHEGRIVGVNTKKVLNALFKHTQEDQLYSCQIEDMKVYDYVMGNERTKEVSIESLNNDYCQFNLSPLREEFKLNDSKPKLNKMSYEQKEEVFAEQLVIAKHMFNSKADSFDKNSYLLDNKLLRVLSFMEINGVMVDEAHLQSLGVVFKDDLKALESKIFDIAGEEFKLTSPKVVAEILFDKLELPSKTKKTGEPVLLKALDGLKKNKEIDDQKKEDLKTVVESILRHRTLSKFVNDYVEGLSKRLVDGKVFTTYNQTTTKTGRLSSTDPNLQNIPAKTEEGKRIRGAFIAPEGWSVVALDYSQIELRILAHLAQEAEFIKAFVNGEDVHKQTAANIFEIALDEVTDEQRRIAKSINFGLIYGMSERRLAEEVGIAKKDAKLYYGNFFDFYSGVKPYFEKELDEAKENLFVETFFGRKISTQDIKSSNPMVKSHAEKSAKNARIQGTAADIIKMAMVEIFNHLRGKEDHVKMIMQVHDELVFIIKDEVAETMANELKSIMENVVTLDVPLSVDYNIAKNWQDAH